MMGSITGWIIDVVGVFTLLLLLVGGAVYALGLYYTWLARNWRVLKDLYRYMHGLGHLRHEGWEPGRDYEVLFRYEGAEPTDDPQD